MAVSSETITFGFYIGVSMTFYSGYFGAVDSS